MPPLHQLSSFHIIENDNNDKNLMTWTYPCISDENKTFILNKILQMNKTLQFIYLRNKKEWFYVIKNDVSEMDKLLDIKHFSVAIIAKDFNPNKYETLARILSKCYCRTGHPVELVRLYLSVYTTGACSTQENGAFVVREFENNRNSRLKIKDFINMFGLETILIYTAMLLKKRIVFYHHTSELLLKALQSVTILMLHRDPGSYLYPLTDILPENLAELKSKIWFVAGFTDSAICSKTDIYDLLVNLPALEINIMPHAKESLSMTKIHKDIAVSMVQMAEDRSVPEAEVAREISDRTRELLNHLKTFATADTQGDGFMLTVNDLKSRNLHPSMENFLFNLAVAENLIMF